MQVAVVGAGIAGLTISFLLSEAGHKVVLFEQAEKCGPVGAGILLQPSGQHVLAKLNLLKQIEDHSPKLEGLTATCRNGKTLVDLNYDQLMPGLYSLGVRRSLLFSILFDRCIQAGVQVIEGAKIQTARDTNTDVVVSYANTEHRFDLLIAADGSRSVLRSLFSKRTNVKEYSYSALWALTKCENLKPRLIQIVDGTKRLIGVLPVEKNLCSFFWGIHQSEKEQIWNDGLDSWKKKVLAFEPKLAEVLESITSLDQLSYSTYRSAKMNKFYNGRVVFIGDAAHASSPHLGQGVNLALEDAYVLAEEFAKSADYREVFANYNRRRKSCVAYYYLLTGVLTPFFQSDHALLGFGRNIALPLLPKIPFVRNQMISSMSGLKRGWLDFKPRKLFD